MIVISWTQVQSHDPNEIFSYEIWRQESIEFQTDINWEYPDEAA
jgi:hypothetical protein